MAKFVLMFHGGDTPEEPSPAVMDRWIAWFGELGDSVVDMGAPFGTTATIASDGTPSEGSGPDPANGYTVIEAANLHDAVVMAKGCPGVPETVWNFRVGGYQVCQKWLKDRKGRTLSGEDIVHYQKMVIAIARRSASWTRSMS